MNPEDNEVEDLTVDREDSWRELPGQGIVSPSGTVFSKDGEAMYTLVEDDLLDQDDGFYLLD